MASERESRKASREIKRRNKDNRNISGNLNSILDQLSTSAYGSVWNDDVEKLNSQFNDILKNETDSFNHANRQDTSSFIMNLFKNSKDQFSDSNIISQISNIFDDSTNEASIRSFINDSYRNRMLKQSDIHEVANQLIELREAILITRDAIISSDIVEGKMTRNLKFDNTGATTSDEWIPIVEAMEEKFKTQDKIKNFIVPKTLEYGEYYTYTIPYKKVFSDFMKRKQLMQMGTGYNMYHEKTLYEFVHEQPDEDVKNFNAVMESVYEEVKESTVIDNYGTTKEMTDDQKVLKESFDNMIDGMLKNITICNDPVPLMVIEESVESLDYFMETCIDYSTFNEKSDNQIDDIGSDSYFKRVINSPKGDGIYSGMPGDDTKPDKVDDGSILKEFKDIHDCYVKVIDPTKLIPVQIMTKRFGYYYVQNEEITPITGVAASSLYYNRFEDQRKNTTVIDNIATKIVQSFDKKFLDKNDKFKDLIIEALNYYNLNEVRLRFQFIPAEYVAAFKVSEDENENGTSIIEPSLFYAKLYLMLLLFKMMSIILYSNDQRINYVKTSGIDKNVRKKIEEIARVKQQRSINVMDMFSYTSLVNKLGVGAETYIPTGKSGERGLETEVIQGQDVQLNSDLMDNLRKSYILGTGVPDAIMNYMNEADFAKSLELANTRFQGRVVSYQYDFNRWITTWYKMMMRWSTNIPEEVIDTFEFSFAPPKASAGQIKAELIQNFDTYANWVCSLFLGQANLDNPENEPVIREMKKRLAKDYMPMINFDQLTEMFKNSNIDGVEKLLEPKGEEDTDSDLEGL